MAPKDPMSIIIFSPTIALYIICTAVCIWWMQLTLYRQRKDFAENGSDYNVSTDPDIVKIPLLPSVQIEFLLQLKCTLPQWCDILLQLMMFILIIGRWLLPKGKLSRDQLSQLLLVQIGIAADILELLSEGFSANLKDIQGAVWVLIVWSWSLPQFTLSLTVMKRKKHKMSKRLVFEDDPSRSLDDKDYHRCREVCCATDMWSILLSLLMQDVPFLVLRLWLIYSSGKSEESLLMSQAFFFSCKNAVVILLQMYRVAVILSENRMKKRAWKLATKKKNKTEIAAALKSNMTVVTETAPEEESTADIGVWYTQQAPCRDSELRVIRRDVGLQTDSMLTLKTDRV
ncbi:transmembrane protein 26-like [Patiria miniata]|uniref:Transmembrane protein 26 n=1 Tax=Patiria miniata TaxID=46514 RepID=A0A914BAF2_PATMI|nr:transmembrane protein 26-like [Patiria miniata]